MGDNIKRVEVFIVVDDTILRATPSIKQLKFLVKPDDWEAVLKQGRLRKDLTIEFDDVCTGVTMFMSWWQKLLLSLIVGRH